MTTFGPNRHRRDVWLNDLPFSSVDEHGNRWVVEDIDGWWDLPPVDMGEVDRTYSEDGSYYEPGRFSSRAIRLTGKIIPPRNLSNSANIARQEFNRRLQLVRRTGLLQVLESDELGGGKQSEVVIVARPLMKSDRLNGVIDFDVQFRAPDPRKYSTALQTVEAFLNGSSTGIGRTYNLEFNRAYPGTQRQNTATVNNIGDYSTYGIIRLHGPVDNPGVQHLGTDRYISFPGVRLATGQYIDIDLGDKTIITESGISLRDRMDDGSRWFKFDDGITRVTLLGDPYLDYVPSVPDAKNLVQNPSFESTNSSGVLHTVRSSHLPNPSGMENQTIHNVDRSLFPDHQAQDPARFSGGTVSNGVIQSPAITLVSNDGAEFPLNDGELHQFAQIEVRANTTDTPSVELTLGTESSGVVPISADEWTTVRVDSSDPGAPYQVDISTPGASPTSGVLIRNIMVISSENPIAAEYPFWQPVEGVTSDGIETSEVAPGEYLRLFSTPDDWESTDPLRALEGDGVYLIPEGPGEHVISFGDSLMSGNMITYGVVAEGLTEVRLYDASTEELLDTQYPSSVAYTYKSETPIIPRIEATVTSSTEDRMKISGAMVTFDGGTTVFTDRTPNDDGFYYYTGDGVQTAIEQVRSFVSGLPEDEYNLNAKTTQQYSYTGSRSLEVTYNTVPVVPLPTPISLPDVVTAPGTYYARAKIMANQPTLVQVDIRGAYGQESHTITANPGHWADVRIPFEATASDSPYITVTPMSGGSNIKLYADAVGIMTSDIPYFDGDMEGPYTWSGVPHSSTSATIPVEGVPHPRMEIMYRHAWIG